MIVSMYMTPDVASVTSDSDAADAVRFMCDRSVRCLPVIDAGQLVGIVSRADLLRCADHKINPFTPAGRAISTYGFTVSQVMATSVTTVSPTASIEDAAELLDTQHLSGLVVIDEGLVVGMLSRTDILRAFREIMFQEGASRFTLVVDDGVDVVDTILATEHASALSLQAYAEHRQNERRYVFIAVEGDRDSVDTAVDLAWSEGVRVLQVRR